MEISNLRHPFGEICCEDEVELLQDNYSSFYFSETPFNREALYPETFLIVGRRGTGKTSLSQYFEFQDKIPNTISIDVDEPDVYAKVLSKISETAAYQTDIAIPRIVKIWEYVIWALIFDKYKKIDNRIEAACLLTGENSDGPSHLIKSILKAFLKKFFKESSSELADDMENFINCSSIKLAQKILLEKTKKNPIIVSIDSLEKYSIDNIPMMRATAALIQCSSNFNTRYSSRGVHVKTFMSAEIFPHLCENEISNTSKYVKDPVHLH